MNTKGKHERRDYLVRFQQGLKPSTQFQERPWFVQPGSSLGHCPCPALRLLGSVPGQDQEAELCPGPTKPFTTAKAVKRGTKWSGRAGQGGNERRQRTILLLSCMRAVSGGAMPSY